METALLLLAPALIVSYCVEFFSSRQAGALNQAYDNGYEASRASGYQNGRDDARRAANGWRDEARRAGYKEALRDAGEAP